MKRKKCQKSLGNVLDPKTVIEGGVNKEKEPAYGADVLRLWSLLIVIILAMFALAMALSSKRSKATERQTTARYRLGVMAGGSAPLCDGSVLDS
jgi:isoleucyl-tRNA synthetase